MKKIKQLLKKVYIKYELFKTKLSLILPTYSEDKQKHFFVVYSLTIVISVFGSFLQPYGIYGLVFLFILTLLWEIPTLIKNKFTRSSILESIRDIGVAFSAILPFFIILLYHYTKP